MKQDSFKSKHTLAHKILVATSFAAMIAIGTLVVPRLVDKVSNRMIKGSAGVDIPDEAPEIIRNENREDR